MSHCRSSDGDARRIWPSPLRTKCIKYNYILGWARFFTAVYINCNKTISTSIRLVWMNTEQCSLQTCQWNHLHLCHRPGTVASVSPPPQCCSIRYHCYCSTCSLLGVLPRFLSWAWPQKPWFRREIHILSLPVHLQLHSCVENVFVHGLRALDQTITSAWQTR